MLKKTIYVLIASVLIFTSCKKDTKIEPVTPAEAKTSMNSLGTDLGSDVNEAMSSEGVDAIFSAMNLMQTSDPFTNKKKSSSSANSLTMADLAGTYTWSEAVGDWTITTGTPSDQIIVKFPVDSTAGANLNGVLTITALETKEQYSSSMQYDWNLQQDVEVIDTSILPLRIAGNLLIDGNEIVKIDFTAAWDANSDPTSLSANITIKPVGLVVNFSDVSNTYTVSESLKLNDATVQSVSATVNYAAITDEWGDNYDSVYYVDGYIQYQDVKVKGTMNIGEIDKISNTYNTTTGAAVDPTVAQLNQYVDLTIYSYPGDQKMADVQFYQPSDTSIVPVQFVLTDASVLSFEEVVNPMIDEIDKVITDNFDDTHSPIDVGIAIATAK